MSRQWKAPRSPNCVSSTAKTAASRPGTSGYSATRWTNERTPLARFASGALCRVVGDRDRFLGYAYVNPHALICARILGRDPAYPPGKSLFVHRLQVALALRERSFSTPWYRLAYGESDGLPGVVFDRYGDVVVGQIATAGMEARKPELLAALEQVVAPRP